MSNTGAYIEHIILCFLQFFILLECIAIIADILSLLLIKNTIGQSLKYQIKMSTFWKIFGFTNLSFFIGLISIYFLDSTYVNSPSILAVTTIFLRLIFLSNDSRVMSEIFRTIIIIISANMLLNFFFVFNKNCFSKPKRFLSSLIVSVLTAPYFFYYTFDQSLY